MGTACLIVVGGVAGCNGGGGVDRVGCYLGTAKRTSAYATFALGDRVELALLLVRIEQTGDEADEVVALAADFGESAL